MSSGTTKVSSPNVGIIGLGIMGTPIARHVLNSGRATTVLVSSRRAESADALVALGAEWRQTPAEIAREASIILLVVPDLPQVRDICLGAEGIAAGASRPTIVVVHSTCAPDGLRELQVDCDRAAGPGMIRLVDAPVSGGEEGARSGTLAVMLGGTQEDVQKVEHVINAFGSSTHFGSLGAGQIVKACNQIVVASAVVGLAEAAVVAENANLDVRAVFETLSQGYAASRVLDSKRERFATHDHSPSGAARFMIKDLSIAMRLLEAGGAESAHTLALLNTFTAVTSRGWGDLDTSVAQEYIAGNASY